MLWYARHPPSKKHYSPKSDDSDVADSEEDNVQPLNIYHDSAPGSPEDNDLLLAEAELQPAALEAGAEME